MKMENERETANTKENKSENEIGIRMKKHGWKRGENGNENKNKMKMEVRLKIKMKMEENGKLGK